MRARFGVSVVLAMVFLCAARSGAGDKKDFADFIEKPGPEHKMLAKLAGQWQASVKLFMEPGKDPLLSKGTMTRKVVMDGRFVREDYTGEFGGAPFVGMGIIGYDINKKKYVTSWIDSMSTGVTMSHGSYDADKKTFTYAGAGLQGGKKVETKDILRIISDDEQTMEMHQRPEGSKEFFQVMEITFKRQK